ncbi:hypothetical protein XM38_039400 [Halomicronema hongdechloris C2206]|uniref:Uncharacterized protein n=1 Tax=Halomicronema hongdechloris C2206 TaxID=1641165 RepID=A0A1Z3HRN0_9CYAN|nr:hypothetical protein XM38_039400 [Halomicronema hongdechloris C2206]
MRQPYRQNQLLHWIGISAKLLFATLLVATVLCLLGAVLGVPDAAWSLYTALWPIFWKSALTLICLLAITISLSSL